MSDVLNSARALAWLVAQRVAYPIDLDPDSVDWSALDQELLTLARRHGVVRLVRDSPAAELLPPQAVAVIEADVQSSDLEGMRRAMVQTRVRNELEAAGIPAMVMKGIGFSALAYGDWAARGFSVDLDLLMAPESVYAAEDLLIALGFQVPDNNPRLAGPRTQRYALWLHYQRGLRSKDGGAIDLHWRALPGGAPWNTASSCLAHAVAVETPVGSVATLGPAEALVVACAQGAEEQWRRYKRLADLWAAYQACSPAERNRATAMSTLVAPSLEALSGRWLQLSSGATAQAGKFDTYRNLWATRRGSGSAMDAATRSLLGAVLPARRVERMASLTKSYGQPEA